MASMPLQKWTGRDGGEGRRRNSLSTRTGLGTSIDAMGLAFVTLIRGTPVSVRSGDAAGCHSESERKGLVGCQLCVCVCDSPHTPSSPPKRRTPTQKVSESGHSSGTAHIDSTPHMMWE